METSPRQVHPIMLERFASCAIGQTQQDCQAESVSDNSGQVFVVAASAAFPRSKLLPRAKF